MKPSVATLQNHEEYQDVILPEGICFDTDEVWLYKEGNAVVLLPKVNGVTFQQTLEKSNTNRGSFNE